MNSRRKGKTGELDARDAIRQHWHAPNCIRAAQANGKHSADLLNALPSTHVEVKRHKRIAALDFLRQAEDDAPKGELPIVVMREDGDKGWAVLLWVADAKSFGEALARHPHASTGPAEEACDA